MFYNPAGDTPERFDRYGEVARRLSTGQRVGVPRPAAEAGDLARLVELHREYCTHDEHPFVERIARAGFEPLLRRRARRRVDRRRPRGYAVLTWGWSIEGGGLEAVLDEIYVTKRGEGIGSALIDRVLDDARRAGLARMFLETEAPNSAGPVACTHATVSSPSRRSG